MIQKITAFFLKKHNKYLEWKWDKELVFQWKIRTAFYNLAVAFDAKYVATVLENELIDFYNRKFWDSNAGNRDERAGINIFNHPFAEIWNDKTLERYKLATIPFERICLTKKTGSMDYDLRSEPYDNLFKKMYKDIETREETDEETQKRIEEFNNRKVKK